ncbi:sporulation integral membrane protein YtvI [Macrococcus armenti]|uniref:sporulation integral membrane protein YtvI n=1 Tax=Macrococcus armenti TaxID=2875764 RepID=UPI001CCE8CCB|nr:sporulation integral membrane protein YtvI [Macrococcus armenti]UBH09430.1 sporulation integral membrane protein YtvI [Macrococcus armenti]UBH11723.1 sporulation integral membrane protein YtvI [Macrococcus armenti]
MLKRFMTKRNITILSITIITLLFLYFIVPISVPLIVALLFALMIEPIVKLLEQKVNSRKWSVTIIYTSILSLLLLFMYLFLTKLIQHIIQFSKDLPDKMNNLLSAWSVFEERLSKIIPESVSDALFNETQKFLFNIRDAILNYFNVERITNLVASLPETFITLLVFLVALFLFMLEIPNIQAFIQAHTYEKTYNKGLYIWRRISASIFGMLRAAFILSGITWFFTFIGLLFITPKNALVLSFIICLVDLLPILGATGVTIPWALYAYITGDPALALKLIVLSVFLLVQRKVLEPKVMGKGVGLSPLPTLIAMFIGLKLMGFVGFFIGPIILIVILIILESGAFNLDFKI